MHRHPSEMCAICWPKQAREVIQSTLPFTAFRSVFFWLLGHQIFGLPSARVNKWKGLNQSGPGSAAKVSESHFTSIVEIHQCFEAQGRGVVCNCMCKYWMVLDGFRHTVWSKWFGVTSIHFLLELQRKEKEATRRSDGKPYWKSESEQRQRCQGLFGGSLRRRDLPSPLQLRLIFFSAMVTTVWKEEISCCPACQRCTLWYIQIQLELGSWIFAHKVLVAQLCLQLFNLH